MNHSLLKHYAQAFFSLGKEKDKVEVYKNDLDFISNVFKSAPDITKFLASPMILKKEKDEMLEKNLKPNIDIASFGFLQVLIKKKVIAYFEEIKQEYDHLYNEEKGILEGKIYTPFILSEKTMDELKEMFFKKLGKKVEFKTLIDKNVIAGMRIYINDVLYDYSIDTKLNQIKQKLTVQD